MDMDAAEELKLSYTFEWEKNCHPPPPGVEIDPPEGSVAEN
jgi:hypothetical protein